MPLQWVHYVFTLSGPLSVPCQHRATLAGNNRPAAGCRPAMALQASPCLYQYGIVHMAGGEGWQVNYTDAAIGHQVTVGTL